MKLDELADAITAVDEQLMKAQNKIWAASPIWR
jgi:hypothetical protein